MSGQSAKNRALKFATIRDRANSLDLRYAVQEGSSGTTNRWLVMCDGRTEWIEKYENLGNDLGLASDTGFIIFDHRGQGASGGARSWIDSYNTYASDMADIIQATTHAKPYSVICHSMGGLITLVAIMEKLINPRSVVLCSPLLGLPNVPVKPKIAFKVSRFLSTVGLGHLNTGGGNHHLIPFEKNLLTQSMERYLIVQNTPYPSPSATFEWVRASYEATQLILQPEKLKNITMPILVLSGTDERVVDSNAIQPWVTAARAHATAPVEFQWVHNGRHELLFETKVYYEKTLEMIRQWHNKIGCPL